MLKSNKKNEFTVADLLKHLRQSDSIPALDENVTQLCRMTGNSESAASDLTSVIMRDAALTSRLLGMANSACLRPRNPVKTVSAAVILFGFERIQQLASGLTLFHKHAADIRDKELYRLLVCAYCTGNLAMHLARKLGDSTPEELFVSGLMEQLPRLILANGFPEQYRNMEHLITNEKQSLEQASKQVFGVPFSEITAAIADYWKLHKPDHARANDSPRDAERRQQAISLSVEVTDLLFGNRLAGPTAVGDVSMAIATLLKDKNFSLPDFVGASANGDPNMEQFFKLNEQDLSMMTRIAEWGKVSSTQVANSLTASFQKHTEEPPKEDPPLMMAHFLSELMLAVHKRYKLNDILMIAQEGIFRCMNPECVIAAFIDRDRQYLQGRLYAGHPSGISASRYRVALSEGSRLAAQVMLSRETTIVETTKLQIIDDDSLIHELKLTSVMIAPIIASNRTIGQFFLGRCPAQPPFTSDDSLWISAIASHIGMSFEQIDR